MTKMKSKKMTKSTFAIIIMAIAMVAMLAFGGTYAYFTATAGDAITAGPMSIGKVILTENEETQATAVVHSGDIVPGATIIQGNIEYVNKSTVETLVAVIVSIKINDTAITNADKTATQILEQYGISFTLSDGNNAQGTADQSTTWEAPKYSADLGGLVYVPTGFKVAAATTADGDTIRFTKDSVKFDKTEHHVNGEFQKPEDDQDAVSIQGTKIEISITSFQTQLEYNAEGTEYLTYDSVDAVIASMEKMN